MTEDPDSPPEPMEEDLADSVSSLIIEPCLVCGLPAKGLHFQLNTCRACAAFFRRSVKSTTVYRCQKGAGNCDVTQKTPGKPLCRYCRLKKCVRIGMKIENAETKTKSDEVDTNDKKVIILTKSVNVKKDFNNVRDAIYALYLKNVPTPVELGGNMTTRLTTYMNIFLDTVRPKGNVISLTDLNCEHKHSFFEEYLLHVAELTMHFEYFIQLPVKEKFLLYRHFWSVFHHIERVYMTVEFFGDDINDGRLLIDDKHCVDATNVKFNIPGKTPEQQDTINNFLEPLKEKIHCLAVPMKRLRITLFELCYISQLILWSCFEIDDLPPSTHALADNVISKASDELHHYYVKEMRISNYAPRQAALLKMINFSEFIVRSKNDLRTVNKIFNLFDMAFVENELS